MCEKCRRSVLMMSDLRVYADGIADVMALISADVGRSCDGADGGHVERTSSFTK
jgi:hypothetical protein